MGPLALSLVRQGPGPSIRWRRRRVWGLFPSSSGGSALCKLPPPPFLPSPHCSLFLPLLPPSHSSSSFLPLPSPQLPLPFPTGHPQMTAINRASDGRLGGHGWQLSVSACGGPSNRARGTPLPSWLPGAVCPLHHSQGSPQTGAREPAQNRAPRPWSPYPGALLLLSFSFITGWALG